MDAVDRIAFAVVVDVDVRAGQDTGVAVLNSARFSRSTVNHGDGGTFTLVVHNEQHDFTDTYAGLTMGPDSADEAVRRAYDGYPDSRTMTTARRLESSEPPEPGTYPLASQPVIFSVHTPA